MIKITPSSKCIWTICNGIVDRIGAGGTPMDWNCFFLATRFVFHQRSNWDFKSVPSVSVIRTDVIKFLMNARGNLIRDGLILDECHCNLTNPLQSGRRWLSRLQYYDNLKEYIAEMKTSCLCTAYWLYIISRYVFASDGDSAELPTFEGIRQPV